MHLVRDVCTDVVLQRFLELVPPVKERFHADLADPLILRGKVGIVFQEGVVEGIPVLEFGRKFLDGDKVLFLPERFGGVGDPSLVLREVAERRLDLGEEFLLLLNLRDHLLCVGGKAFSHVRVAVPHPVKQRLFLSFLAEYFEVEVPHRLQGVSKRAALDLFLKENEGNRDSGLFGELLDADHELEAFIGDPVAVFGHIILDQVDVVVDGSSPDRVLVPEAVELIPGICFKEAEHGPRHFPVIELLVRVNLLHRLFDVRPDLIGLENTALEPALLDEQGQHIQCEVGGIIVQALHRTGSIGLEKRVEAFEMLHPLVDLLKAPE